METKEQHYIQVHITCTKKYIHVHALYGMEGCCEEGMQGEPSWERCKGMGVGEGRRAPVIEGRAKGSYMYLPNWLQTWDFPNIIHVLPLVE